MLKHLWLLPFFAMVFTPSAHALNDSQLCDIWTVKVVANWAEIEGDLMRWWDNNAIGRDQGLIAAASCRAMPNSPKTTIAVIAFNTTPEESYGDRSITEIVALVEGDKVVAANRLDYQEDGDNISGSYRIDTARYILSKDVRAFGVVSHNDARTPCAIEGDTEDDLSLWVRKGENLHVIFETYLSGWITIDGSRCGNTDVRRTALANMTIGVEKTSSHGFADLSITAHVTELVERGIGTDDYSEVTEKYNIARKVFKYNGQSYVSDNNRWLWWHPKGW